MLPRINMFLSFLETLIEFELHDKADCSTKLVLPPKNFCPTIDFLNFFPVKVLM